MCFKIGRVTIPPAVCFALEGLSRRPESSLAAAAGDDKKPERYSHANPPPGYVKYSLAMQEKDHAKGHLKTLQAWLRGGWREDVKRAEEAAMNGNGVAHDNEDGIAHPGETWWAHALGGEVEERRRKNLELVRNVKWGMEGAGVVLR